MASDEVCIIWKPLPRVRRARRPLLLQENLALEAIPAEAVQEIMDVNYGLVGLAQPAMGEPSGEREEGRMEPQQGEIAIHLDPDTLSYVDSLFSQEDLLNKVDEILQSRFVSQLLSADSHLDLLALTKELLELEEALALVWLLEKLRLAEEEEEENGEELAAFLDGALQSDSGPSESVASQGAQSDDYGPQEGVNTNACPPDDFKDGQEPGHVDAQLAGPQAFAGPSESQECPPLGALGPPSAPQGLEHTDSGLGPRDAAIPRQTSPVRGRRRRRPVAKSSEKEGPLPDQVFAVASLKSVSPSALSLSPVPASDLACPRGRGARKAAQSRPPKRKCEQSVAGRGRKRKRYNSQCGAVGGPSCPESGGPQ
ncbi:NUT family member 2F-like [Pipistrellus kuhlii]|uniref:Nuclear Testis protein N-terminal domain-containing protein n=1 Tax=Pipistrellus kuhlii TaxID=59472 RepID=A0A7J7X0C8_PIPKU|nr:NUT family member 2F-like [Pipistrellus kuhlii]KAF6343081.1 hypothetical protein mPipKuh1_010789 [Pipistrellus kuhlii]